MEPAVSNPPQWQGLALIAHGANRVCVRDPQDAALCLKFELPANERTRVGLRQRVRRWLGMRMGYFGENQTELRAYRKLRARLGDALDGWVARCHGLAMTRAGVALQCECVLQEDGRPARSLYSHLFETTGHDPAALCGAIDRMEAWLLRNNVPLFDLNAGNLVVSSRAGQVELVCVDAKSVISGKEILPFSRWSRVLMHRKLRRRAQRLRQRVAAALADGPALAGRAPPH
ncbi:YrbL family protein [Pseudoxanthomonas gei]|nr:YrbL family protein [Pseudoxanthomonas gei]